MVIREKRKQKQKQKQRKRNRIEEQKILKKIDTLPYELVGEIYNFLPLHIQNMVKPLEDVIDIYDLMVNFYWVNFHLYFYDYFNKNDIVALKTLKKYFDKVHHVKYVKYGNRFYEMEDERLPPLLIKLAEIEVGQFLYSKEQHDRNISDRIGLSKTKEEICRILHNINTIS